MFAAIIDRVAKPGKAACNRLKNSLFFIALLMVSSCAAQPGVRNSKLEGMWNIELLQNDIGIVRTVMSFETDGASFEAYTRKKADKDLLGGWTALLGRTFTGSFKNGSLLRIEQGILSDEKDTLLLAGILRSALGDYALKGYVVRNEFFAKISDGRGNGVGSVSGNRNKSILPMEDYATLFEKSIVLTERKIYNRGLMQTKEWKEFVRNMRSVSNRVQDDLEMVFAFFYYAGKLPVTHYALMKLPEQGMDPVAAVRRVFLEEKSPRTVYLNITSFDGSSTEMDSIFSIIKAKNYSNLIVDLRNNSGGSVEAGMAFATQLADTTFYGGVFLTQRYFNNHKELPRLSDYEKFPHFTAANFDLILKGIHEVDGLCLKVIPNATTYKGKVYVLTGRKTASTCEPIVYGLKQRRLATLVGETTAGAMLNGEVFDLDRGFKMVIPTADYYASDGFRIDQQGVAPDVEVKQAEALNYVLEHLIR